MNVYILPDIHLRHNIFAYSQKHCARYVFNRTSTVLQTAEKRKDEGNGICAHENAQGLYLCYVYGRMRESVAAWLALGALQCGNRIYAALCFDT